jgi:hypothetical protein
MSDKDALKSKYKSNALSGVSFFGAFFGQAKKAHIIKRMMII